MLGRVRTPKREAAWKANGERLKADYAELRRLKKSLGAAPDEASRPFPVSIPHRPEPDKGFIAPKGSFTKEDLKALIGAKQEGRALSETPVAPFDFNVDGEPHRVTQMGKHLGLYYLGGGEPVFARYLAEGELEKFWEKRILK